MSYFSGKNKILIALGFFIVSIFITIPVYSATLLRILPKTVNMGIVKLADYEAGYIEKSWGNILLVSDSINDWKVMVKTNDDNMGVIGDYTKPITDFTWKARGDYATQITYTSIENYDIEAARGPKGGSVRMIYIDYRILLAWANDVPGDYNIDVVYTLTTQ